MSWATEAYTRPIDWHYYSPTWGHRGTLLDVDLSMTMGCFLAESLADPLQAMCYSAELVFNSGPAEPKHRRDGKEYKAAVSTVMATFRPPWPAQVHVEEGVAGRVPQSDEWEVANCEHPAQVKAIAAIRKWIACAYHKLDVQEDRTKHAETAWPKAVAWVVERLPSLGPEDLPPVPWELGATSLRPSGRSFAYPGVWARVTDSKAWLDALRRDVAEGANGSRFKTGAIFHDLFAVAVILREKSGAMI